jgi:hypothetical protein
MMVMGQGLNPSSHSALKFVDLMMAAGMAGLCLMMTIYTVNWKLLALRLVGYLLFVPINFNFWWLLRYDSDPYSGATALAITFFVIVATIPIAMHPRAHSAPFSSTGGTPASSSSPAGSCASMPMARCTN